MCTLYVQEEKQIDGLAVLYALPELPKDFKRVLRIQCKEFIHFLDDAAAHSSGEKAKIAARRA